MPLSPQQRRSIAGAAMYGLTDEEICYIVGLPPGPTMKDPKFKALVQENRARSGARVAECLFNMAKRGNVTACIFWLKCKHGWVEATPEAAATAAAARRPARVLIIE